MATALQWVQSVLLGTVGTAIAVIAIAGIGFQMLTGRIDVRRGLSVIFGCFIVFGAPTIASALQALSRGGSETASPQAPSSTLPAPALPPAPAPHPYDPYAGASVPRNH
ncbi:TrbC/VirB2 family protein [uncultured Sphingomonas sp.]|uniref:TrbC/VirB2 family protein n=1 Tax=uncultured Sphingomonas sp. TaxID=158754 RepID=UPI0025FF22A9|nr:TrbC/VirB2 family protein [uncultured Sphingomonas sp.]